MKKIEINDFDIKINRDAVFKTLGCSENSDIYNTICEYFTETEREFKDIISPKAFMRAEGMRGYCVLTIGDGVSEYTKKLFDKGEGMHGVLADAMADEYLFEMDKLFSEQIKFECAKENYGVSARLEAPADLPLSEQKVIIKKTGIDGIELTDAFMLKPVKTLAYIIEFTEDINVFNAQHDCSKCPNLNCPRRSSGSTENFEILSGYKYMPKLLNNSSAVCIDIGTTTVVFQLIAGTEVIKTYKTINPQRRFGLDVLSRIEASNRGRGAELASIMQYALLTGYKKVTEDFGDADKIVIAANTTMVHLLLGRSCRELGEYPFKSDCLDTVKTTFDKLTNNAEKPIETIICGGISGFVGGDIVSGLYMCGFDKSDKVNMFIDLGTNGEMAIGSSRNILVTSAAAGPAFEGGRISCGIGSVDGAVCGIDLKSGAIKTINSKPPSGLCGTGIIELTAELLDTGIIDNTGLMSDDYFVSGYKLSEDIVFTQSDTRQVQMAKAAVKAGIDILAREYGVELSDINKFYLAGGFSHGLSIEKACRIGLLPYEVLGKTEVLGNSSLGGCAKYCSEPDADAHIEHIKSISREFPLAEGKGFEEEYIKNMNFS